MLQDKFSVALRFYITLMYKIMWPPAGKNTLLQETENKTAKQSCRRWLCENPSVMKTNIL